MRSDDGDKMFKNRQIARGGYEKALNALHKIPLTQNENQEIQGRFAALKSKLAGHGEEL